jgi:hypothetical protein
MPGDEGIAMPIRRGDHGRGNVMLALGANVHGGRIFGAWPGFAPARLESGADLAVTTDYTAPSSRSCSSAGSATRGSRRLSRASSNTSR